MIYRDLPKRTLTETGRILDQGHSRISKVAAAHQWVERAAAWDAELDHRIQRREISALENMKTRQIQLGMAMQSASALELQALVKHVQETDKVARQSGMVRRPILAVADLIRLVEAGAKIERLNRGEPSEIVESRGVEENLQVLSMEELVLYRQLIRKMEEE